MGKSCIQDLGSTSLPPESMWARRSSAGFLKFHWVLSDECPMGWIQTKKSSMVAGN